ncbi:hypothetical protein AAFF_G00191020 [Aldrovandia affinis]|uniref:Uncharacterized protein n=1 Tax=Aldrovandia affinis TaxID=143900 RepID=A0AAD7RJF9_9TELE|nr:hypothetical protein AAFF_G00191020 [Aldrovandia affinis]
MKEDRAGPGSTFEHSSLAGTGAASSSQPETKGRGTPGGRSSVGGRHLLSGLLSGLSPPVQSVSLLKENLQRPGAGDAPRYQEKALVRGPLIQAHRTPMITVEVLGRALTGGIKRIPLRCGEFREKL